MHQTTLCRHFFACVNHVRGVGMGQYSVELYQPNDPICIFDKSLDLNVTMPFVVQRNKLYLWLAYLVMT